MTFSERVQEFNDEFEETGSTYQAGLLIPDIVDDEYFESLRPEQEFYECRKYNRKTKIDTSVIEQKMNELVKENVPKNPIFTYIKRKNAFIEERKEDVKNELFRILNQQEDIKEQAFNENEKKIEIEENKKLEIKYKNELADYEKIFNPTSDWLTEKTKNYRKRIIDKWGGVYVCFGASAYLDKTSKGQNRYTISLYVDNLSTYAERYPYKYSITAAGNDSRRLKTDKQIEEEYAQNICALAFVNAVCLFNVCLDVKEVLVNCFIEHVDSSTGNEEKKCLYSVIIPRELVKNYRMENLNTVAAIMSLEGRADIRKERDIYFVDPLEWNLEQNSENNDTEEDEEQIRIDFRKFNIELCIPEASKEFFNYCEESSEYLKQLCHDKVKEFELFSDEFDADNYADGLYKFLLVFGILKLNKIILKPNMLHSLGTTLKGIFSNNSYAIKEIDKLVENNVFIRLMNEEPIKIDFATSVFLKFILNYDIVEDNSSIKNEGFENIISINGSEVAEFISDLEPGNYTIKIQEPLSDDNIDDIGHWLFDEDKKIKLILPDSLTKIKEYSFHMCSSLVEVIIPNSVREICRGAFSDCSSLVKISLPDTIIKIDEEVFSGCTSLKEIKIPQKLNKLPARMFENCESLQYLMIPDCVTDIGEEIFKGCTSLKKINIPHGLRKIPFMMFENCTSLSQLSIPDTITEIEGFAFKNCSIHELTTKSLIIRDGFALNEEEDEIEYCTDCSLSIITIPSYVKEISVYAFEGNKTLSKIIIPNSVSRICASAFSGCTSLTHVEIPDSLIEIEDEAFNGCTSLTNIEIPPSVNIIGKHVFQNCAITELKTDLFEIHDGYLLNENNDEFLYLSNYTITQFTIPDTVKTIGENAFSYCSLEQITIPEGVTTIKSEAFRTSGLKEVYIPKSVKTIGKDAFSHCLNLKKAFVPSGCAIEGSAFPEKTIIERI